MYPFPDYHHIHQLVIINFRSAILSTLMSIATSYIILFVSPFPRAVSVKYQHRVCNLVSLHISDHHYNFIVSSFGQSVTIIKATLAHEQRHSKLSTSFLLICFFFGLVFTLVHELLGNPLFKDRTGFLT